jgi:hypothetical protein
VLVETGLIMRRREDRKAAEHSTWLGEMAGARTAASLLQHFREWAQLGLKTRPGVRYDYRECDMLNSREKTL